eukprot:TRINITY_DN1334_c0_g2_i1.p1 TRINITY_DN1334_c0_g2~~TRINITY_DN1334_c0_g2_i1.p1  ORF type:complete len:446 (-),score=147.47 TRINITY_DN1334_c0_g2_i1:88-1236(-)
MSMKLMDQVFTILGKPEDVMAGADDLIYAASRSGDQRINVLGLCKAADALALQDKPQEAMEKARSAQELCEELGFEEGEACVSYALARIHARFGGNDEDILDKALDYGSDALSVLRSLGCKKGEGAALMTLGDAYQGLKDQGKAVQYHKEAVAVFRELGEGSSVGHMYRKLAEDCFFVKTDVRRAGNFAQKAIALFQEAQEASAEAECWTLLAQVQGKAENCEKAVESIGQARNVYKTLKDNAGEAKAMGVLVHILMASEQYAESVNVAKEIVTVQHEAGDKKGEAEALLALGQLFVQNYDHEKAKKVAEVAERIFKAIADGPGYKSCERLKAMCEHARATEMIETSIYRHQDFLHVPEQLIVDPGRNKRVQSQFEEFAKSL